MRCPRCETTPLEEREREGLTVDVCLGCRGIWLDRGELERLIARAVAEQEAAAGHGRVLRPGHDGEAHRHGGHEHDSDRDRREHEHQGHDRYRDGHHRKRRWYEALGDVFD